MQAPEKDFSLCFYREKIRRTLALMSPCRSGFLKIFSLLYPLICLNSSRYLSSLCSSSLASSYTIISFNNSAGVFSKSPKMAVFVVENFRNFTDRSTFSIKQTELRCGER